MTAHLFTTIKGIIDLVARMKRPVRSKQCHCLQFAEHIEFLPQKFVLVAWRSSVLVKSPLSNLRHRSAGADRELEYFPMSVFIDSPYAGDVLILSTAHQLPFNVSVIYVI